MKKYLLAPLLIFATTAAAQQSQEEAKTIEIITRVNDYWQQHHSPEVRAFWDEAAYHTGNMEAFRTLGHARWMAYSTKWATHNNWQGATEKDFSRWKYKNYGEGQDYVLFADWQICFQTYLDLNQYQPAAYKTARAENVIGYVVNNAAMDYWWWADALYMAMPIYTKLYRLTGNQRYLDKLAENFRFADSLMYDNETGLYYRDGRYIYPKHKTDTGKKDFWARGNGWVIAAFAKVLDDLPEQNILRPLLLARYKKMAKALAASQQAAGYWTRSMLDPEQAEGPETSGTAFFSYGLQWGVNRGILDEKEYQGTLRRAWHYLTQTALQPSGAVGYVQPIGDRAVKGQTLSEKNEANFGVGAFLLAACEHLKAERRRAGFTAGLLPERVWQRMQGRSWPAGCPLRRDDLRYLQVWHYDARRQQQQGEMVCHKDIAPDLVDIFRQLYVQQYPIERMCLIDDYQADDETSMSHNNTTCFCYRPVAGTKTLSKHALGRAVDINPLYNPCVRTGANGTVSVQPAAGRPYARRDLAFDYKIERGDLLWTLFTRHGFRWGGTWRTLKDYQHFEK